MLHFKRTRVVSSARSTISIDKRGTRGYLALILLVLSYISRLVMNYNEFGWQKNRTSIRGCHFINGTWTLRPGLFTRQRA